VGVRRWCVVVVWVEEGWQGAKATDIGEKGERRKVEQAGRERSGREDCFRSARSPVGLASK
jgi:hypothetical protein